MLLYLLQNVGAIFIYITYNINTLNVQDITTCFNLLQNVGIRYNIYVLNF